MEIIEDGILRCRFTAQKDTHMITYIISPIDIDHDFLSEWAYAHKCNVAVFYGMDWESDLTPWATPAGPAGQEAFAGKGPELLRQLQEDAIPTVERAIGYRTAPERHLIGVSLSGLFALWAWMQSEFFSSICSISGSLWYVGFVDWLQSLQIPYKRHGAYFSLGSEEPYSHNPLYATVGSATSQTMAILNAAGVGTTFEQNPGNHYAPFLPRLQRALAFLQPSA
ncbi:MAG: hypothetical protein LIP03_10630 [Bacteroidales bacterium]|nr:hypothetical protein [Bacteroidales bacterium]